MKMGTGARGVAQLCTGAVLGLFALTGTAIASPLSEAVGLIEDVCMPAIKAKAIPDAITLPSGYQPLNKDGAARYLGGEEGEAFGQTGRADTPIVALWKNGRCSVYVRQVKEPAATADGIVDHLGKLGLALVGTPETGTTPAGAKLVVRNYAAPGKSPAAAVISHHSKDGQAGGVTLTLVP